MKNYNILYTIFGMSIICCYSFCMKQPKRLPQTISRQLITTHNVHEQEKKLLQDIIGNYPHWIQLNPSYQQTMQRTSFSVYTPQYFKDIIQMLKDTEKTDEAMQMAKTLENQAILYITYVAINNELWPTIEDKLIHINNCFQEYTLPYLKETWKRYEPKIAIATIPSIPEELPYEKGTVEEVSSEEEEKTILEQPISSTTSQNTKEKYKKTTQQPYSPKTTKSKPKQSKEQKKGWLSAIWNTTKRFLGAIKYGVETIYYSFLAMRTAIFGEPDSSQQ